MCGRYVSVKADEDLLEEFDAVAETEGQVADAGYNVAPTTRVRIVVNRPPHGEHDAPPVRQLRVARWGLVPSWAKSATVGNRMFNARAESMTEKKSAFARAFAVRRCLVPADGWYEWQRVDGPDGKPAKQPYLMIPGDGHELGLAGLYEFWRPKDDPEADWLLSTTILTVPAQGPLAEIHERMPLVVARSAWQRWLDPHQPGPAELLEPEDQAAREGLELRPVSSKVNRVGNDSPDLIERVPAAAVAQELF